MEQQTQWTRPGYRPNYSGGTPPLQVGSMNRSFSQTITPELSRAERLEAQRLAEQSKFDPNRWCNVREDKRKSRQITCKPLAEKLFALMDWEAVYSYRFQGMKIDHGGEIYYMFDLSGSEPYLPRRRDPETGKVIPSQTIVPEEWKNSFGMNFAEHEASQKIDLMQGYVTAGVTEDGPIIAAEIK